MSFRSLVIVFTTLFIVCKCDTSFNRERSIIRFNLYGKTFNDEKLDSASISSMIQVISTKFQRIQIRLSKGELDKSTRFIPNVVARWNSNRKNSSISPLILNILIDIEDDDSVTSYLNGTIRLANQSNYIYPGTVPSFTINFINWNKSCSTLNTMLSKYTEIVSLSGYKFWIYINLDLTPNVYKCMKNNLNLRVSVSRAEALIFWGGHLNVTRDGIENVKYKLAATFKKFQSSIEALRIAYKSSGVNPQEMVLRVHCFSIHDIILFVQLWKILNTWTLKTNNTAYFYEAFDDPVGTFRYGWWRTSQDNFYYSSDNEYEEKETVVERENSKQETFKKDSTQNFKSDDARSQSYELILSVGALGLSILALVIASYLKAAYHSNRNKTVIRKKTLRAFYFGSQSVKNPNNYKQSIENVAYDRNLEVADEDFTLDILTHDWLKSRSFIQNFHLFNPAGLQMPLTGQIMIENQSIPVTIKFTGETASQLEVVKLMREIKFMSYLRSHENIVKILGANTSHLCKGKLYMFTEHFDTTLEDHLRVHKNSSVLHENLQLDLIRWSKEIADALVFITEKQIVMGCLISRNILLGPNKQIKLCFCGQFWGKLEEDDSLYAEIRRVLWRNSAPETIQNKVFNEKTDVWSFGLLVWEMLTLGELPFADVLDSNQLLLELSEGRKLPQPVILGSTQMYTSVISKCIQLHPCHRPSFKQLVTILESVQIEFV